MKEKGVFCYDYPRPAYTADILVFRNEGLLTEVLLIERKNVPFKGTAALPGGFVDEGETALEAAKRELFEETGLDFGLDDFKVFGIFDRPGRDPRGWTVTVVFYVFVSDEDVKISAGDDASDVGFFPVSELPDTAFDHGEIIEKAVKRLFRQF